MYKLEKTISVNRSQQEVFDFVSDPANATQWNSGIETGEWTSEGPVCVGSTRREVGKFLGRKLESTSEVTVWDPPNQTSFKSVGGPFPFEATYKFEPKENGTLLTVSGTAEFGGFFKLAEGLVGKQMTKQFDADFATLKRVLEAG